jgi:alpha-glucosidase (family GH31 glycosyl hydrolase)
MRRAQLALACPLLLLPAACDDEPAGPASSAPPVVLASPEATVDVRLSPFELRVKGATGDVVLATVPAEGVGATVDSAAYLAQTLPGWDGYAADEAPWRYGATATARDVTATSATFEVTGSGLFVALGVSVEGRRVRLSFDAREAAGAADAGALNKATIAFALPDGERFFGLGERYASVDHRGLSLYSWAEEGALGGGEDAPLGPKNPYPNGPSMTYFPVPFFLSSEGYGLHLATSYRTETHFGSEDPAVSRVAVNATSFEATIYVSPSPLAILADYTEDTGRPIVPAPWVFGPRRRVNLGAMVDGVPEWQRMRERHIPITGVDDAVHFLPALSQLGREDELAAWTATLHEHGYKALCYNNPYVAKDQESSAADYARGVEEGHFIRLPNGEPALTQFISGKLLTLATIDLTSPDAVAWFKELLSRSLALGYDGWMHDFGEYVPRDAVLSDGRRGDEVHNEFPVLSAKAAYELLSEERPDDFLFFVRSGYSGTQAYVPAVWGGDAEATFDETLGLPSAIRGGLNLSMSGVPYWGSDMTGFKCITNEPRDKEVFLRWVELGAVSPIMMEQDACSNPVEPKAKWRLWNDEETIETYARYARLHTRLSPYFDLLALEASRTGSPITRHPFLVHPEEPAAWEVEDSFYLGPSLYASPVVRRGLTTKAVWLPPGARYVDLDDLRVYAGGAVADVPAPLGKLPLYLVEDALVPMLDASIDTLAPATDPSVVTPDDVADRLDVLVALGPAGKASLTLADGTTLVAERLPSDAGNPGNLAESDEGAMADCARCFVEAGGAEVDRLLANGDLADDDEVTIRDVRLTAKGGPARRVRWEVLRLP